MKKLKVLFTFFLLLFLSPLIAEREFGYLLPFSYNIGDDIQGIAAKQFLPDPSRYIDREYTGVFYAQSVVPTILNGWMMHVSASDFTRYRVTGSVPPKLWPPSPYIDPLLISIHITSRAIPVMLSEEGVSYFQQHGPVGARDLATLQELQSRGIDSYFSGCLTLTLNNPHRERDEVIYAVDLDEESLKKIKERAHCPIVSLTHFISKEVAISSKKRLKHAHELLEKYRRAKCVVTTRLHCAMPCLAFETPVLLLSYPCTRLEGLKELTHHCTKGELLSGEVDFDFDHPPPNPPDYLPLREELIERVFKWVEEKRCTL